MKRIEQEGEPKTTRGKEEVVRNRRPRETVPGHSQKIEARWWKCVGEKTKTGEGGCYQTAQVAHGDGQRKKSKNGEDGSYHIAHVGPGDRGRKKSKKGMDLIWIWFGFNLDWYWSFQKTKTIQCKLLSQWFCFLLFSILFLKTPTSCHAYKLISRNELARPAMGTIFLIYISVCLQLSMGKQYNAKMRGRNHVVQTRACSKSVLEVCRL